MHFSAFYSFISYPFFYFILFLYRYLYFYSFIDIYILLILFLYSILSTLFPCTLYGLILLILFLYSILFLPTRFPCSLYQRGWDCTAWWISPCVGVSLCVDVRLCRVSSCTWPDGDALVSRGLVPGV